MIIDRLRSLVRRVQGQHLRTAITVEVTVGAVQDPNTGKLSSGALLSYDVLASDFGRYQRDLADDSTMRTADGFFVIPIPSTGLPFEPAVGQVVVADGSRWFVHEVRPVKLVGIAVSYRLEVAEQGS